MHYRLPLTLESQPEGGFTVTSPVLPELLTEGDSVADALDNVRDAFAAVLEIDREQGRPLPAELASAPTDEQVRGVLVVTGP